ncbi:bifunctional [glutamate--ammonia ligase]-adenylyl-L-tyrosine phosphorylase/[glutamate--ammonia-ligase] adenylyltransferase, partial [Limnohabitans sp.]|uniref:bifunctional [glutamate--ammonia ligase]-adenylyl-L-tyrosine phosphorylase/[glutamate--ammonia-ligase] adenylyltransferase n=1 Tax=Limnohabitans sp. TaxID=1907725 RepID=UPI00391DADC9
QRLARAGLMPQATADALSAAYGFLRQVEHRIQYLDDQQTHVLPVRDDDLAWMAATMGHASTGDFLAALDTHRELVAQEFDTLLGGDRPCKGCNGPQGQRETAPLDLVLGSFSALLKVRLEPWLASPRVLALRDDARARLSRLLQRTAQWLEEGRVDETAVLRMADWIEPLLRREVYLSLLLERPSVHERLLRLLGAARWPARYLVQHPGVIDELAGGNLFSSRFDAAEFEADLHARRTALQRTGEDDEESLLNLLRRAHHAEQFRTLARDVEGVLSVEQVADDLSALADAVLRVTARWCWDRLKNRHRDEPRFAVIGYGKLGGKELGYGSDLDIVFVYDDEDDRAQEVYAAFVRKLINWMTVKTGEGDLYEIDTALRPNGNSGLLVTRFQAYADYQQQRGSNTAWTWEHQAMTRARFVVGLSALQPAFDAVRQTVISAPRDAASLRAEIVTMREKVRQAHAVPPDSFDLKHSPGGMVDVEFVVQYLVLLHTARHPELADNVGNIALLHRAEAAGLLPAGLGHAAADAYREMRRLQHRARLDEQPTQVAAGELADGQQAVRALWSAVMQTP